MSINKDILFNQIEKVLYSKSSASSFHSSPAPLQRSTEIESFLSSFVKGGAEGGGFKKKEILAIDYDFLIKLIHQVIFHESTQNCIIK
jgi:hypothetical protein